MRDVPALITWLGGYGEGTQQTDASIAANWGGTLPTYEDYIQFVPSGVWPSQVSVDCIGLAGEFAGMNLEEDYTGTVELGGDLLVSSFNMQNGTIDQLNSSNDFTITGQFSWTAGTITSSCSTATMHIQEMWTASIDPGGGTLGFGSHLSIEEGARVTMGEGTIEALNDDMEIVVDEDCGLAADPGSSGHLEWSKGNFVTFGASILIRPSGWVELRSGTYTQNGVVNTSGRFTLFGNTTFTARIPPQPNSIAYNMYGGMTQLYSGSTLSSPNGVSVHNGHLMTVTVDGNSDATIVSSHFVLNGGDLSIGTGTGSVHYYGTLNVVGDVSWADGTFHPFVCGVQDFGASDLWKCTGTFTILNTPALAPTSIDFEYAQVSPTSGSSWYVIKGETGITRLNNAWPVLNTTIWSQTIDTNGQEGILKLTAN